ncbi:MAG: hypothetical protein DI529_12525 [Chryseobacterium sp.]|nr:MAG: hypothetical protein DI529_12525 [Chryseobacterium sp.]
MKLLKNVNILRLIIFLVTSFFSYKIFLNFASPYVFDKTIILSNLITTISVLIAIIITYLFSKLFSEKSIRVDRKKDIDELAKKLTYLRRIAFHLRGMNRFWNFKDFNPKSVIDYKYKDLTWEQYRGLDDKDLNKRDYRKISYEIGEISGQAYLALKGLQDDESDYSFFGEFHPLTYSLNDLAKYRDYSNSVWYFFENSDSEIVNLAKENRRSLNFVDELYLKIFNKKIDKDNYNKSIKDTFSYFESEVFDKLIYLTSLNTNYFPKPLIYSFLNMLVYLIILLLSIFILVLNIKEYSAFIYTILILSLFIANTFDLIVIMFYSIKKELKIDDILKF